MTDSLLLRALRGQITERPPIWLMRQAGRYLPEYRQVRGQAGSFLDLCYNPELAAEVTLQPIRRFNMDAAILFSDILVVPDALGCRVEFRESEGPVLERVTEAGEIAHLRLGNVRPHLAPVYDTVARVRTALPAGTALIGFAGAPWTVASYMVEGGTSRDFMAVKRLALEDPDRFQALIDVLVAATTEHLSAQIAAGADAVQLFDSWAGALPGDALERWCIDPTRRIVQALRAEHGPVPIIGFARGLGANYRAYARGTGVAAIGLDQSVAPSWAAESLPRDVALQGNLDPVYLLIGGARLKAAARRIVDVLRERAFIFNLGHGVVPETPPEHVGELVRLIRGDDD
ncbi:MAG TPA: uroporphyrinogen decarboxylase [Alphaproteobacteria bacterium]|jgi:uroporphyrinogen decarboxylase|nr:uroporphyrinogen decarboxylase [Alphaproteobacteria bacterium]